MRSWQRSIYYLGLALVEATPAVLLMTLVGSNVWGIFIGITLLGALIDWQVLRRIHPTRQRVALVVIALIVALWVVKAQVTRDYGLLGDWGSAINVLTSMHDPRGWTSYLSLLGALYCFWRGTQLTTHDSATLQHLFRRLFFILMVMIGLSAFTNPTQTILEHAANQVVVFFAVGLITIALANIIANRDDEPRRLDWRGFLTLCLSIALVVSVGLLVGALFGYEVGQLARQVLQAIVLIVLIILSPLLLLLGWFLSWLFNALRLNEAVQNAMQQMQLRTQAPKILPETAFVGLPAWVAPIFHFISALLPILLIIGFILLARRRLQRQQASDEERESLWSWNTLANDLRDLFANLRGPDRAHSLRAALARLHNNDPTSRVRRSYIRLLLVGEARKQPRNAPQTPYEYAPAAGTLLPNARQAVDTLTAAYERARYHANSTTAADASAAEQAWQAIEQADKHAQ